EAGVVPGTVDQVPGHQALRQRAAVVGAGGADRQHVVASPHQKYRLSARVPQHRRIGREVAFGDSGPEIGSGQLRLFSAHALYSPGARTGYNLQATAHATYWRRTRRLGLRSREVGRLPSLPSGRQFRPASVSWLELWASLADAAAISSASACSQSS